MSLPERLFMSLPDRGYSRNKFEIYVDFLLLWIILQDWLIDWCLMPTLAVHFTRYPIHIFMINIVHDIYIISTYPFTMRRTDTIGSMTATITSGVMFTFHLLTTPICKCNQYFVIWFLWCLLPLSTIFQLYHGSNILCKLSFIAYLILTLFFVYLQ